MARMISDAVMPRTCRQAFGWCAGVASRSCTAWQVARVPLAVILREGQWSKHTGLRPYIDECELEAEVALELAIESDGEECDWID